MKKKATMSLTLTDGDDQLTLSPTFLPSGKVVNYIVDGGDGNDHINIRNVGNDVLKGGAGDDFLASSLGNDTLTGGNGNDSLYYWEGSGATLKGGVGDDWLLDYSGLSKLFGGEGNDWLTGAGRTTLSGGDGFDTFQLVRADSSPLHVKVTDFQVGMDRLYLTPLNRWGESNPLTADNLRFSADGTRLVVEQIGYADDVIDVGNAFDGYTVAELIGVGAVDLTWYGGKG